MSPRPTAFISYAQENADHKRQVRELADWLVSEGIDCELDQYHEDYPGGWTTWASAQITNRDFVLTVLSPLYRARIEQRELPDVGHGAKFEGIAILARLTRYNFMDTGIVPIHFGPGSKDDAPHMLYAMTRYDVSELENRHRLRDRLLGRAWATARPPLGEPPALVVRRGYIRPILKTDRGDGLFEGDGFRIQADRLELGNLPAAQPHLSREVPLGGIGAGSYMGHGPATFGNKTFDQLNYAGRLTILSSDVRLDSGSETFRVRREFAMVGAFRGYVGRPFTSTAKDEQLAIRLIGSGLVTAEFQRYRVGDSEHFCFAPISIDYAFDPQ